jgi:hypothetical protein
MVQRTVLLCFRFGSLVYGAGLVFPFPADRDPRRVVGVSNICLFYNVLHAPTTCFPRGFLA